MTKSLIVFLLLAAFGCSYAQMNSAATRSIFSDLKAGKAGDALMILILEDTQADNSAGTSQDRDTEIGGSVGASSGSSGFDGQASLGTNNSFKGKGQTTRQERIRSRLSAKVVDVEPNGNLKIEGRRTTQINGETQSVVIKGTVRPYDIMPNNTIYSYSILDLTLIIEGDGSVSEVQEPGLITKFLRFLF